MAHASFPNTYPPCPFSLIHSLAVIWMAFYIGAFISGLLIRTEQFALGHAYGRALLLMSCLLTASGYALSTYGNRARLASLCPAGKAEVWVYL